MKKELLLILSMGLMGSTWAMELTPEDKSAIRQIYGDAITTLLENASTAKEPVIPYVHTLKRKRVHVIQRINDTKESTKRVCREEQENENNYPCYYCDRTYTKNNNRYKHIWRQHNAEWLLCSLWQKKK